MLSQIIFRDDDLHLLKKIVHAPAVLAAAKQDRSFSGRYYLSVCAILKNEARYISDWVRFHHALGVDHFYLYDNDSSDQPQETLAAWVERGIVSLFERPGVNQQMPAYADCIRRFRGETRWMLFIDIDEFVFPTKVPSLPAVLRNLEYCSGVFVPEHIYGSGGHVQRQHGHPGRTYLMRAQDDYPKLGKSFVNPRRVRRATNPHMFQYWIGTTSSTDGRPVRRLGPTPPFSPELRLNHYWSKSIVELADKHKKGDAVYEVRPPLADYLQREQFLNAVFDDAILRVLDRIENVSG